ncbi:hypothetical protein DMUE_3027 [Dictyocoela muelleri]|nr:hypothetical protein DMUE_3027 [Dictyocoela muelleri]
MTDYEFYLFISENKRILELFQSIGSIQYSKKCENCKKQMEIKKCSKYNIKMACRCSKCKRYTNLMADCELRNSKIDHFIFLRFAFYFNNRNHFTVDYIMKNCKIGEDMYKTLLFLFRTKIGRYVEENKRMLGGVLKEVQIDESFWTRRKYGVGRLGEAVWIWDAVEKKNGILFFTTWQNRNVDTLLPLIHQNIKQRSYFVSDKWPAYKNIGKNLQDSVGYKYNFIDPETKANTQCIENLSAHLKKKSTSVMV